jgi:hypothetical protein
LVAKPRQEETSQDKAIKDISCTLYIEIKIIIRNESKSMTSSDIALSGRDAQ